MANFEKEDIIELFKKGFSRSAIATKYHTSVKIVDNIINEKFKSRVPDTYPSEINYTDICNHKTRKKIERLFNSNKGKSRKEIIQIAKEAEIVIPIELLDEKFGKEIDLKEIWNYVINSIIDPKVQSKRDYDYEAEIRKNMYNYLNAAGILKEKNLDISYEAVTLITCLYKIKSKRIPGYDIEISATKVRELLNNNESLLKAIEVICSDENNPEYYVDLEKNEISKNVMLAIILEKFKRKDLDINNIKLEEYYKMAKGTSFEDDFEKMRLYINVNVKRGWPSLDD